MGLLVYLLIFWTLSYLYHEFLCGKHKKLLRKVKHLRNHLRDRIRLDSDILFEKNLAVLTECHAEAVTLFEEKAEISAIEKFLKGADRKIAKVYPKTASTTPREIIEMLIVVFGIVMGVRALFLQPFKIPTGSMQPTLFGIHFEDEETIEKKNAVAAFFDWVNYSSRNVDIVAKSSGGFVDLEDASTKIGPIAVSEKTKVGIGNDSYIFPGTQDQVFRRIFHFSSSQDLTNFYVKEGDVIARGKLYTGDHIMVDRISYNFVNPQRGDTMVFRTDGLTYPNGTPLGGLHYIKRMVGLPGDTLKIVDTKLYVKNADHAEFTLVDGNFEKGFERMYTGKGGYHGYTYGPHLLTGPDDTVTLKEDEYFAMGDNSRNSADSRYWGIVPRKKIIGRAFCVWWPFSRRWGPVDRVEPLDVPTPAEHMDIQE
ncbi:signal peptidase I [bacterium M21]|nr:signal peptidase I [bacterium M21]